MATRYQVLVQEHTDLTAEANTLLDIEELTEEQTARLAAIEERLPKLNAELRTQNNIREQMRTAPAVENMAEPLVNEAMVNQPEAKTPPTPYRAFGEQMAAVARAGQNPHMTDSGLLDIQAAALGGSEGVASDGGFLVQTDFESALLQETYETAILVGRTDRRSISANANGMKMNAVDETSRADGSRRGGIQAYWTAEAGSFTKSKPTFRQMELTLQKLTGLYYATDEELADTTALGANISAWFAEEFGFKLDDAIIRGGGAGMPLGILGHAGTVSVAKEGGQTAVTFTKENAEQMFRRMRAASLSNAEWYINQNVWPQIFQLSQVVGVGGVPVFLPPGGMSSAPFGTLLGRPITPIEQAETLGTVGDVIFADWSQYLMIEKGGIEAASSIHVQFLTDETVFRFILRTDGQPKRNAVLAPFKGSSTTDTTAPFVTLATRA
jgi:HK97 family phage major capsid protein